jgi:hypothetical protein
MRWRARALPSTTGLTISRWEGLAARRTSTFWPEAVSRTRFVAEVIFHVAVAADGFGDVVFGKLFEEHIEVFPHDAREDVEAAAVGHAHDDLLDADARAVLDDGIDGGDHRLATLEGEPLLADVFGVEEAFEELRLVDAAEDADFFGLGEAGLVAD